MTDPARRHRQDPPRYRPGAGAGLPFSPWHLVLVPLTFVLVVPLLWMLVTSLQTAGEANRFPPVLFPHHWRFANYARRLAQRAVRDVLPQQRAGHARGGGEQPGGVQPGRATPSRGCGSSGARRCS